MIYSNSKSVHFPNAVFSKIRSRFKCKLNGDLGTYLPHHYIWDRSILLSRDMRFAVYCIESSQESVALSVYSTTNMILATVPYLVLVPYHNAFAKVDMYLE
jgi:hypothetical protein